MRTLLRWQRDESTPARSYRTDGFEIIYDSAGPIEGEDGGWYLWQGSTQLGIFHTLQGARDMAQTVADHERVWAQFATELPKNDLYEALPYLRRPFTAEAVRFKVQQTWTKSGGGAVIVSYIDARLVVERLNHVVGECWYDEYEATGPAAMVCRLTVAGVTRTDVGEASGIAQQKALRSDALKRAAVKFGVGVSVYAVPKLMLSPADGLRPIKVYNPQTKQKDKDSFALTDQGERLARERYGTWLTENGVRAFGEPLDHGDTLDSQGDYEIEPPDEPDPAIGTTPAAPVIALTPEQQAQVQAIPKVTRALALLAAGVNDPSELSQATLPVFMDAVKVRAHG